MRLISLIICLNLTGVVFGAESGAAAEGAGHNIDQGTLDSLTGNDTSVTNLVLGIQIGDAGAIALAEALKTNTSLKTLSLAMMNQIGVQGARALADALKANTSLTELYLLNNEIGDALSQEIRRLMSPEGLNERRQERERRLNTFWYPNSELALTAHHATHTVMCSWGLAPQLHPVVWTVLIYGVRIYNEAGVVDEVIALQPLPNEIWLLILQYLRCRNFGQQQALGAP